MRQIFCGSDADLQLPDGHIFLPLQNFFHYSSLSARFIEVNSPVSSVLRIKKKMIL